MSETKNTKEPEVKTMKVKRFTMQNVKAVNCFDYEFPLAGTTVFGGKNNQGKTTILNGMQYTIGGEAYRPTNYKKEGSEGEPYLRLEFSNGIVAERIGESADLKIWDANGEVNRQRILDKYLTTFALDLPKFLNGSDKDRCEILLRALHVEDRINKLDEEIQNEYDERTIIGRYADQKRKAVKEMPFYSDVPAEEISSSAVLKRQNEVLMRNANVLAAQKRLEENRKALVKYAEIEERINKDAERIEASYRDNLSATEAAAKAREAAIKKQIDDLTSELATLKEKMQQKNEEHRLAYEEQKKSLAVQRSQNDSVIDNLTSEIVKAENSNLKIEDTSSFQAELEAIEGTNAKVRANRERQKVQQEADAHQRKYDEHTATIEAKRRERSEILIGAGLPYPGLSVENKVVCLNGKAWDCMSESMKIRVGCAIVSRINPSCKFMYVDKLEELDQDSMAELNQFALDHDIQIIGTRVTTDPDDCTVIIKNGYIEGMENKTVEIPKITRRRRKSATADDAQKSEADAPADDTVEVLEPPASVEDAAMTGQETSALARAKELLNRKRQQEIGNA